MTALSRPAAAVRRMVVLGLVGGVLTATGGAMAADHLLAVSWQPAFCETHRAKPECATQTRGRFDADHFALHGLWPQPRGTVYCGVAQDLARDDRAGRWDALPDPSLDAATRAELRRVMPGTQSRLERHEWIKHGTCYGAPAEAYFAESLALMRALNGSPVRDLFAGRIGRTVTRSEIRAAFDTAFGAGAGARVEVTCTREGDPPMILELRLHLRGTVGPGPDLGRLLTAAEPARGGCAGGRVDRVGYGP